MPRRSAPDWYVISLRPRGEHAALRRAAASHGAGLIALSPWVLQPCDDRGTRAALRAALATTSVVLFTSPAAVRAAARLRQLRPRRGQTWLAVGSGTAAALRRAGVLDVITPTRMDSEGLLALPQLQDVQGHVIGLITAPGGRDALAPALRARGAQVLRADVYVREAIAPSSRALAALRALDKPAVLALSSAEALQRVLTSVPADIATRLRTAHVVAASARLSALARELGFNEVVQARSPLPADLLAAARALP